MLKNWGLLLLAVGTTHGFFFTDPFGRDPFWKNFEKNMKQFEESFKQIKNEDLDSESSENTDMIHAGGDFSFETSFGGLPGLFGFHFAQPWWKGKNVCVSREELDESTTTTDDADGTSSNLFSSYQMSSCKQTADRYVCTTKYQNHGIRKTFTVKYECCHGYQLQQDESACVQVNMKSLGDVVMNEGGKEFSRMFETTGLWEKLKNNDENYTVFAVTDETLGDLTDAFQETNQLEPLVTVLKRRRRESELIEVSEKPEARAELSETAPAIHNILLNHVVKGIYRAGDLNDKQRLESLGETTLKVHRYPGVVTINCARITSPNRLSENGVVHMIDRVLKPVTQNLADMLSRDPRFKIFHSLLQKAGLLADLMAEEGEFTVFAPTDAAFEKLPKELYDMYVSEGECVDQVLAHHIAKRTLCLSALSDFWLVTPMSGEPLQLTKNIANEVVLNEKANVLDRDLIAKNGVVHTIDTVLIPDSGKRFADMLAQRNLSTFYGLLTESDLLNRSDRNVTWFVPREKSLDDEETREILKEIRHDKERLRELLLYHSVEPQFDIKAMKSGDFLDTRATDQNLKLPLDVSFSNPAYFFSAPMATVQCARVKISPSRACGVSIHELDRLLVPPTKDILQFLTDKPQFSILTKVLKKSGLEEELKTQKPLITILAPTDDAFNDLPARVLNAMLDNEEEAKKVILRHVMPESRCCHGISSNPFLWTTAVQMKDKSEVQARRNHLGHVHFGRARVLKCDQIATNGIVHTVNRVLMPRRSEVSDPFKGLFVDEGSATYKSIQSPNAEVLLFGI